jgi:hypothetical protein
VSTLPIYLLMLVFVAILSQFFRGTTISRSERLVPRGKQVSIRVGGCVLLRESIEQWETTFNPKYAYSGDFMQLALNCKAEVVKV